MTSLHRYLLAPGIVVALMAIALMGDFRVIAHLVSFLGVVIAHPFWFLNTIFDMRVWFVVAVAILAASLLLYLLSLFREDSDALVHSGRSVEALIPVHNEPEVMHRSVEHLAASTYEDLTITIVCEPDDQPSIDRATDLAADHERVKYILSRRPGSKAGALNNAIERSDADVIAMFDADQEPHPRLIAHGMAALREHDIARVRSLPRPTGLIESMAYYEYLLLFFLPQKLARSLLGLGIVGTRSVLIERSVFDEVGQFDERALTEDMDFTHRCNQANLSIRELLYYPCYEEAAHTLRDWWGQRVRWISGHVSICHRHIRDWRNLHDPAFLSSLLSLVGTFAVGTLLSVTVPALVLAALAHPSLVAMGLAGIYGITLTTRGIDNYTAGTEGFDLAWLLIPVALTLFGLVVVQVVVSYVIGQEVNWYQVEKHG
ncbi:glycosyltransferase [Natrialba taiwanensis]|uniref:Family 2 glycosyl transferase n=1 Tax=Natrialba taiwanensis DSM 12281 TaxID=1230458 RepID=L9ZKR5_9EURY|nr:glycosyltransferase family 2 protein [Natrialba taiwanensis]ELY86147.1 family 2 glycosyl transferase [Natrialba taiwanensis DSM 12281]